VDDAFSFEVDGVIMHKFLPSPYSVQDAASDYGCGCGCNSCGGSTPAPSYGAWLDGYPDWYWKKSLFDTCPEYAKQVDIYTAARNEFFKIDRKYRKGKTGSALVEKGKEAERLGKDAKKRCKGGNSTGEPGTGGQGASGGGLTTDQMFAASNLGSQTTDTGPSLGLIIGGGAAVMALVIGGAILVKRSRKKAAAAAAASR